MPVIKFRTLKHEKFMKTKGYKGMMGVTIFASLLCVASIVWILFQSYFVCTESGEGCIVWHEELYPLQAGIFTGRLLFKSLFYALVIVFLVKQLNAIKNNVLFPNANVKIIYLIATSYFIGNICDDNISTALISGDNGAFVINSDTLLYAALLVIFALIYKVAVNVSEENSLTI
jgi:hypothetical protein